jgi:single-stranded-DNA-specific exonuclease
MQWKIKPKPDLSVVEKLQNDLLIPYKNAYLLAQRGIKNYNEARRFFSPRIDDLHDPFLMKGMDKAVERIESAIANKEKILVYGDYDVDGTTAVSVVYSYLTETYPAVDSYIPDRYSEGYGISFQGIDFAAENGFGLVIALDCGTKAIDKIEYAREKKVDFIIGDHHTPGDILPDAVALLNPKQPDCPYPYKELSGAGIGFKLIQALQLHRKKPLENIMHYLDLVAVSIGADIVSITGENRTMAYFGLQQIEKNPRPGLRALSRTVEDKVLNINDLVFTLAPRINAAGRIKHGKEAVKLLVEKDITVANRFADEIEAYNIERRGYDKDITVEALQQIIELNEQNKFTTVVYNENWHKGVIGIVASRLIETYYRPTVVFTKSNGVISGSVRSVSGFNVYDALQACSEHIIQFGGHKYAAGLTIAEDQLDAFKHKFESVVKETISQESLSPEILIDTEILFKEINPDKEQIPKFFRILKRMAPFGPGNMNPVFITKGVNDTGSSRAVGKDNAHLKLSVKEFKSGIIMNGIGFNLGNKINLVKSGAPLEIVYTLEENNWKGKKSMQLRIKDIKSLINK